MALYEIRNLSFTYPNRAKAALCDISLTLRRGEFITLCGSSGSGKTTLLRCLKPTLMPTGTCLGTVEYDGKNIRELSEKESACRIGMVMQSPEKQIVTDTVYHELAFGPESLGMQNEEIRARVAETAAYFGMEKLFHQKTTTLSGGQKQQVALASVMVMRPDVLLLDEPTSRLDPIAAAGFITALKKLNEELGTTILLSEHRLEEAFAVSDRVILLDDGKVVCDDAPRTIGNGIKQNSHPIFFSLPPPTRAAICLSEDDGDLPLTAREGKDFLTRYAQNHTLSPEKIPKDEAVLADEAICAKDVFFRYEKDSPDVLRGFSLSVKKGEILALMGGNGVGKTTAVGLLSGILRPTSGKILFYGKPLSERKNPYRDFLGVLPQNPQTLFSNKTVYDELYAMTDPLLSEEERKKALSETASLCRLDSLLRSHPYDLSGGEQQRTALGMVLLQSPEILLLDEPTKGMDGEYKHIFAEILTRLSGRGMTIVMVSHDTEFCASSANRCALMFDGGIISCDTPRRFFSANRYYTTAANRMARDMLPYAVTTEDILLAAGKTPTAGKTPDECFRPYERKDSDQDAPLSGLPETPSRNTAAEPKPRKPIFRFVLGAIAAVLLILTFCAPKLSLPIGAKATPILKIGLSVLCAVCFIPQKKEEIRTICFQTGKAARGSTALFAFFYFLLVPITVFCGMHFFRNRHYYAVSTLVLAEMMIPFFLSFERKKPSARYVVLLSSLCALTVGGRAAFFMLPQFKPVASLVILTGICFGAESGFLMGALSAFLSNFMFGQGPWTPWQMAAFGLLGGLSGILRSKWFRKTDRIRLSVYGFFVTLLLYGGVMNLASAFLFTPNPSKSVILTSYAAGFPMDLIHALSTVFFIWILAEPMIEKMNRIGIKIGLSDGKNRNNGA